MTTPYIIDGYHRLVTLFGSLFLPSNAVRWPKLEDWRWWIWFDLKKQVFVHVPNGYPDADWLPLRAVLRTVDFLQATQIMTEKCPDTASELIKKAELFAQKMKLYKVTITHIKGNSTFNQVVEIVLRLNKPGQRIASIGFET